MYLPFIYTGDFKIKSAYWTINGFQFVNHDYFLFVISDFCSLYDFLAIFTFPLNF